MATRTELVETWRRSVCVMHIAHHVAASRYAKLHRWLGATAAVLAAAVGASIFTTLADKVQQVGHVAVIAMGLLSLLSAALTAAMTFLNLEDRATRHLKAAAGFQKLRREMEEEVVRITEGQTRGTYEDFINEWHLVLQSAPPLPQGIHDRVNRQFESKHNERFDVPRESPPEASQ